MKENFLVDIQYLIDNMKETLIKIYHLKSFNMLFFIKSDNMPLQFKFDCEYKKYSFSFKFTIFDFEYSSKIELENQIEKYTNKLLLTLKTLTKERNYKEIYGENFDSVIRNRWLHRRLERKLIPKYKEKVKKI